MLYRTIVLKSAAQCASTLGMLLRRACIARHVRQLVVRPCTTGAKGRRVCTTVDNEAACAAVREIAGAKIMDALVRFEWDDEEVPMLDDMWFALRIG